MEKKKKTTKSGKKNNSTKKNTTKKVAAKTTTKKATAKKTTQTTKKTQAPKKIEKKVEKEEVKPIEVEEEKVEKVVEEVKPVETKEEILEKTIIFDGKQKRNLQEVVDKLEEETVVVEDKVIKRSKLKKILIIIIAIAMVLVLSASLAYIASQMKPSTKANKSTQTTGSNIYEKAKGNRVKPVEDTEKEIDSQEKYEHIVTITLDQFETKALNKDDMVVLVASSSCSSCIQFEPTIEKVFAELDRKIYRIDIKSFKDDDDNEFRDFFAYNVTPTIFAVKDGVVVADTGRTGRMSEEDLKDWINKNA